MGCGMGGGVGAWSDVELGFVDFKGCLFKHWCLERADGSVLRENNRHGPYFFQRKTAMRGEMK